jgi:hypothetical protein
VASFAIVYFTSCTKNEEIQTFDDVYDVSGILALNRSIDTCQSTASLASLIKDMDMPVPSGISISRIDEMCTALQKSLELTDSETDKLLRNDPDALLSVLERFGNLPEEFGDKNMSFADLENSPMNRYRLIQKEEPGINYYADDYYSAVQEYRRFIESCVIKPLMHIRTVVLKDQSELPAGANFEYYVIITINHNWAMWWSYWRYGNTIYKIKHKGGASSVPHH